MEVTRIIENKRSSCIYGLMGNLNLTTNNSHIRIVNNYKYNGTVKEYLNNKKDIQALKLVMLDENILDKRIIDLSSAEVRILNLAKALIENKDYIVLDYFDKGLNYKLKENFKRLIRKLSKEYNKTFLIMTNDLTFLWDMCEEIIYIDDKDEIMDFSKEDYYKLLPYIDKPAIIKIINTIRNKNIKVDNYKNVQDLLKEIYRLKEKDNEISN